MKQTPNSIFMVRPDHFGYNSETAKTNTFQKEKLLCEDHHLKQNAKKEFESFVHVLKKNGINVYVFDSPKNIPAPDAVFPNNWISFHEDGTVILYPMLTENRRVERRMEIIDAIKQDFKISRIIDLTKEEKKGRILEGTGSIVFDHVNKFAYANESPRTNKHLFFDVCEWLGFEGIFFKATNEQGVDIYHTNVLMTIGERFAVICKASIDKTDVDRVVNNLYASGLEVIDISYDQMNHFAGNMIELKSKNRKNYLVMSSDAFSVLTEDQKKRLAKYVDFLHSDLQTIESIGGGSARCMIAGIHLERK